MFVQEKDLVHKLFKVLVPRYTDCHTSFTQMWNLPTVYPGKPMKMAVLELRGECPKTTDDPSLPSSALCTFEDALSN